MFLGTRVTSSEALVALPSSVVVRSRPIARLMQGQRWKKDAVLAIKGTPAKPTIPEDDSVIESYSNPRPHLHAELYAKLGDDHALPTDLPVRLPSARKLPCQRIRTPDLE